MADLTVASDKWRANTFWSGLLGFLAALVLYSLTVAPTISWGDSADLAMRLVYDDDETFVRTHRDYALWRFFGQAAAWLPIEDAGLRANLYTAFWGAITVGSITAFAYSIGRSMLASVAAGCALAVAHSFWLLSVIAEVYTFNAALVFLSFCCVAFWWESKESLWLWPAALFAGLSLLHHATGLVLIAAVLPLLIARARHIGALNGAIALMILFSVSWPYWSMTIPRLVSDTDLLTALGLRMSQNSFFEVSVPREIIKFGAYLTFNFFGVSILLGFLGLLFVVRCRLWSVLPPAIWASALVCAGVTSSIPDKFNVYVAIYPTFAIFVGFGVLWLRRRWNISGRIMGAVIAAIAVVPPVFYFAMAKFSDRFSVDLIGAREAPLRNNALYFLYPPKNGDFGPRVFAETALKDMPESGILIADYTLWRPLYFVQAVEGLRTDVELVFVERLLSEGVHNWIASQSCDRRIFLATNTPAQYYQLDRIEARFDVQPSGSIFEVMGRCG